MRVALCDDELLFVESMATVLAWRGHRISLVETRHAQVLARLRDAPADICIMDYMFDGEASVGTIRKLCERVPETKIVVLTAHPRTVVLNRSVVGAVATVLSKADEIDTIVAAVEHVHAGDAADGSRRSPADQGTGPRATLTERELAVLAELARGANTAIVAWALGIAPATARSYVQHILSKLGAHTRLEAVAIAVNSGLLADDRYR